MSRSAVTGPNFFVMCSTRSTSSGELRGGTTFSAGSTPASFASASVPPPSIAPAPGSATAMSSPPALDEDVNRHRDDDRQPRVEQQVVRVDALQDQAVLEDPEEQCADQRTDNRARAARQERAADH